MYANVPVLISLQDGKNYARLSDNKAMLLSGDYKTGTEDTEFNCRVYQKCNKAILIKLPLRL